IIASGRGHNNQGAICVLNLFLGWTVLGWLVALIWSASDNTGNRPPQVIYVMQPAPPPPQMPMNGGQQ
ncbi:MAG: superinfection immunity protein, partial [Terriglobales bacterium]